MKATATLVKNYLKQEIACANIDLNYSKPVMMEYIVRTEHLLCRKTHYTKTVIFA